MPNRIIFTSKTKKATDAGKIPSSVDVLVQTDDSPNMDDFRTWASDTNAIISLNRTLQTEGVGNTDAGAQYYNRYGSATLYQTKLIPTTDYAGRSVAAQGDNRSWIRKDYIESYKITARGALDKSKTIFTVNLSGVSQPERLYTVAVPTAGGGASTQPPQSNVLGNPPQLPGIFDGTYFRKLTTSTGNLTGANSLTVTSIYGDSVASFGIAAGYSISGNGIPDNTYVGSSYVAGSTTIPLVDDQGNSVNITADMQNEILYIEISGEPQGVPHYNTPSNGSGARFAVYVNEDSVIEEVVVVNPGNGYSASNQSTVNKLVIPGSFVGGDDGENDVTITSYNLNTYAILISSVDFLEKNININDYVSSEETGIDTFTYSGTAAGTITKQATMVKDQTFITVTNASLIVKGMTITSSTGFGIPQNTIVGDSYVPGSLTVPITTLNGITPQKVTLTYSTAINVTFSYAATFTNITGSTISGSGSGAQFIITKNQNNTYNVYLTNSGSNYTAGAQIRILGSQIGGVNTTNDLVVTVQKVLDKFPAGTRVTFFEKSQSNPGYYDLYLSSLPRTGVVVNKITTATDNLSGSNTLTVTNGSSIAAGMEIVATGGIPAGTYVGNTYQSGNTSVPLTEKDGTTEVTLTATTQNTAVVFQAPTVIENGDGLIFFRSNNSFWSQLNSGSIFEGRPTNFVAWYRATRFAIRNFNVTLLPPSNTLQKYRLYSQRFRVDTTVNLSTALTLNSDWSLYIQVGKSQDPKWETIVITSVEKDSQYTGTDGKIHYVFSLVTQYPSKFTWDLSTETISYCYVYRSILGGIDSSYITQTVPYNKAYLTSEYVWLAPKIVTIPVTNTGTETAGGVFRMNSITDTPTTTFRYMDRDTYSMYFRTWKDIVVPSTPDPLTSNQVRITSTSTDPRYIYASPRTVQFRTIPNNNTYINIDTGTLFLGSTPQTNTSINYTANIVRLDANVNYAPTAPGVWTYTSGRQYLYYEEYAWNTYVDGLSSGFGQTSVGNNSSLSVPYKYVSTIPYLHTCQIIGSGSGNPIVISLEGHGLQANDPVLFAQNISGMSTGSISSRGIRSGTTYYVSSTNLTANSFQISSTKDGASLTSTSTTTISSTISGAMQIMNPSGITSGQTDGIQVSGLHGIVIRLSYKIQAGTTEPIQLQDQYYYIKREFPNRQNIDGDPYTISTISRTTNLVTVVTTSPHRLLTGDRVVITCPSNNTFDTTEASPAIITVVNSTTFRYSQTGSNFSASGGTAQGRAGWTRYLKIDNEFISYDYYTVDGNNRYTLYGVQRAQLGSTAAAHAVNADISMAFDTWNAQTTRTINQLFNTNGSLKPNVALTLQNNWTYTREFPDYGGTNGLLYHGPGRRDYSQPSRWEVAMYGPGYFSPGYLSFVTYNNQNDAARTPRTITQTTTSSGTENLLGSTSIVVTSGNNLIPGMLINNGASIGGIPAGTYIAVTYAAGGTTIPLADINGNPVSLTANTPNTAISFLGGTYNNIEQSSTNGSGSGAQFSVTLAPDASRTVTVAVISSGNNYKIGDTITINASSIGGTGSNLVLTVSNVNYGTLWQGRDFGEPGIATKLTKNPYYQQLNKDSSQIKYYVEPYDIEQRSYEDLYGSFVQSLVKTKNIISGIPDDTTPYYNVRSNSDTILLQASRDQYFSFLTAAAKRPKYTTTATVLSTPNTLILNDATGIEVGDTIYGPGIGTDGAVINSISSLPGTVNLLSRGGVTKIGDGVYQKTSGFWSWDADAYTTTGYTTNVYASAYPTNTTSYLMFGLNTDPTANASYASIDYAWYMAYGTAYIYENGAYINSYGSYFTTTEFRIEYDGSNVRYYKDGSLQRTVARTNNGLQLCFDSSFYNVGGGLKKVRFGDLTASVTDVSRTVTLRTKRILLKDIDVYKYELVLDASLGYCARLSIPNSYGISQTLGAASKYFISEIRFDYVDPIYASAYKTYFFEGDTYSAPILKTEIDNNTGNLFIYLKNTTLLQDSTKEKYDSSLYSLRSKINVVNFDDYKLNPEVTRVGITLGSSKTINVGSVTGILQGMTVTTFNPIGYTNYTGQLPANTIVQSIDSDTQITLNNFPSASGLSALKFTSTVTYPTNTTYTIDPLPNLNKGTKFTLDTAKALFFTTKWSPNQNTLSLYFSPDVRDKSSSLNYPINFDSNVKYYAVDSGDRFVYNISSVSLNSGSSFLSRLSSDTTFANLAVDQQVYFTNIPVSVSLSENTPYYIVYVLNNDIRISTSLGGAPLDISGGVSLSGLSLKMRRVYNTGANKNILRTSLMFYDYQRQESVYDIPSGGVITRAISANGATLINGEIVSFNRSGTAVTTYTGVSSTSVSPSQGSGATFTVVKSSGKYSSFTKVNSGDNYKVNDTLTVLGTSLGGSSPANDITVTVSTVSAVNYTNISATNVTGSGVNATFNVSRTGTTYTVTRNNGGSGYSSTTGSNTIKILGTSLGGASPANDITITITGVTSGVIDANGFSFTGTAVEKNPINTFTSNAGSGGAANAVTTYSSVSGTSSGIGQNATFNVTVSGTTYTVTNVNKGTNYVLNETITIPGTSLGGLSPTNNLTITITDASFGGSNIRVSDGTDIEAGMYVVCDTAGIPTLAVVGSSYVAPSTGAATVPLTDTSGLSVNLSANLSGSTAIFTKGLLKIYNYDGVTSTSYPYTGIAIRPSATGYPVESIGYNVQIPSTTFTDQIQFTFANNTLPQELYPYSKIEVIFNNTSLAQSITSSDTIIKVNGKIPIGYPAFGNIKIGSERIFYGYRTDTFFGDCIIRFPHTINDTISYSPNYAIKPDNNLHNGCAENNNTKLIVMAATPGTTTGYSESASPQTVYVSGFEIDRDGTNTISFPSTAKYSITSDKVNYTEVTPSRTGNSITIPGGTIKTGQTLNDGDEIILNGSFGLGSGYKIVKLTSPNTIQINKPTIGDTNTEYRRIFTLDSELVSGLNDYFIDNALTYNSNRGLKFVGLSGCTDFKPVKCTKVKYATATSNKYSNTITLADDIAATTYALTGLSAYFDSSGNKLAGVKSVISYEGEDYEIKSISGRVLTLVQPLKNRVRFRDTVTVKSEIYQSEYERVGGVKGLIYGPQKAIFYDRFRSAQVTQTYLGYYSATNRYRWRLTFTRGVPTGLALGDKVASNLNYNDYYISCLPSSSEGGTTTTSTQIIVSASTTTSPTNTTNQSIIYLSKPNGYVAREFETASMQIGGYKNASRQQIVSTQVLAEATDGAIADIEAVGNKSQRDIFTASLGEVLGRFLFKTKNFSSSNRPNLWRNTITSPASMNVKTGNTVTYLLNGVPTFTTFQVGGSRIFTGNATSWNGTTVTGTYNGIGIDYTNSRLLFACSSNTIRYSTFAAPTTLTAVTITGSGTNQYITYVNGYYFVGNSTGGLYYSSNLSTWYTITTGNTSPVVAVYYDEFKYIVCHERIVGGTTPFKNYIFTTLTNANMNISTTGDAIQGLTNIFSGEKTVSSTYGLGKIVEAAYDVFDGVSTYSSPIVEVFEYENFSDYTSDQVSEDFQTNGVSYNYGQFFAFGKQISTNTQFAKYSSNARKWVSVDFSGLITGAEEITSVVYGGFNTYIAIVWNSSTASNKILVSNVSPTTSTNLTVNDLAETGRYRIIELSDTVSLYKYKTTVTSQEGNLLVWNNTTSELIWLKTLFGSPLKSNEFTDFKALAAENFVVYTKNSRLLPNFRSVNDANGASRPVTIYNEKLPLGAATISNAGAGYQYGTYVDVEVLNGSTSDYGTTNDNRAKATVVVGDKGTITAVSISYEGDYYPTNTNLTLISDTGSLEGDPNTKLNFNRTVDKSGVTYAQADITNRTYTKTGSWAANATSVTVTDATNIVAGMEVYGGSIPQQTYYVSSAYSGGTSIPLVTATGTSTSISTTAGTSVSLTFKYNFITIPSGSNVIGIVAGMTLTNPTQPTHFSSNTIVLSNYIASEISGTGVEIPISKSPAVTSFANQTIRFTVAGTQALISTSLTKLDSTTFTINGLTSGQTGYCVLYRNVLNGIEFIAQFFNSQGVLIDSIPGLNASDVIHLSRTEMFAQAL